MSQSPRPPESASNVASAEITLPTVRLAPKKSSDLPRELRNAAYGLFFPSNVVQLASRHYPYQHPTSGMWQDLNAIADSHPQLRDEILAWLYRTEGRTIHLLPSDLELQYLHNRTRRPHLDHVHNLYIELSPHGTSRELITVRANRIFWGVMCNFRNRLKKLTIQVGFVNWSLYGALASSTCSRLTSKEGERRRTLRRRLTLSITVSPVPTRPLQQGIHMAQAWSLAFGYARGHYHDSLPMWIPVVLRMIEINLMRREIGRERLEGQYFLNREA